MQNNSTPKQVFAYLDTELGKKLPKELTKAIKTKLIETWLQSSIVNISGEKVKANKTASQKLPEAIKWFEDANEFDYGNIYNDFKEDIRLAIKEALDGKDTRSQNIRDKAKNARKKLKDSMTAGEIENRYRLVAENAVGKARNFSQILSYQELGITKYTISSILDQKTSNICKILNGKTFETITAVNYVNEVLNTAPDKVVSTFPWLNAKDYPSTPEAIGAMTPKDIQKMYNDMPVKLPPYHAFCRTTVIIKTFTESKTIKEAESFAKNLGVEANYGGEENLKIANYLNENLNNYKANNLPVFPKVTIDKNLFANMKDEKFIPGGFFYKTNSMVINPNNVLWKDIEGETTKAKEDKYFSTANPNHFFNHETGHLIFFNKLKAEYIKLRKKPLDSNLLSKAKSEVSLNSIKSVTEFLSEVYAGIQDGKKYSKDIMLEFNKYWRK